jgi:hypothetical protein
MSIIISNITDVPTSVGPNKYEVCINRKLITTFTHNRQDGLATCLRKAADAVEAKKPLDDLVQYFIKLEDTRD